MTARILVLASLGYFVDIFDLFLFSVLRTPSLMAVGVPQDQLMSVGILLVNSQMVGLLLGSVLWGILGDKRGRVSVLYGSIFLYSAATLANAFVTDVPTYAVLRFLAGIGLSGELGAAITLVAESLSVQKRGMGTTIVAGVGLCGGVAAALAAQAFDWKTCYILGGVLGFALLAARLKLNEPQMFTKLGADVSRGNLKLLITKPKRLFTFLALILVGCPIWFVSGILMLFSPEMARALGVAGEVTAAQAILYSYIGVSLGDFASGALSQFLKSRKWAVALFLAFIGGGIALYLSSGGITPSRFYVYCFLVGLGTGYWAVLITMASEHFGVNLRATITTTVPNFIRASIVPMTWVFKRLLVSLEMPTAAAWLGGGVLALAFVALLFLRETYSTDLDFVDT